MARAATLSPPRPVWLRTRFAFRADLSLCRLASASGRWPHLAEALGTRRHMHFTDGEWDRAIRRFVEVEVGPTRQTSRGQFRVVSCAIVCHSEGLKPRAGVAPPPPPPPPPRKRQTGRGRGRGLWARRAMSTPAAPTAEAKLAVRICPLTTALASDLSKLINAQDPGASDAKVSTRTNLLCASAPTARLRARP